MHSSQRDPVLSQQWRCVSRGVATFPTGATFKTIRRGESERNHCPFLPTSAALTLQTQTQETPIFSFNHFGGEIRGKQTEEPPPPASPLKPHVCSIPIQPALQSGVPHFRDLGSRRGRPGLLRGWGAVTELRGTFCHRSAPAERLLSYRHALRVSAFICFIAPCVPKSAHTHQPKTHRCRPLVSSALRLTEEDASRTDPCIYTDSTRKDPCTASGITSALMYGLTFLSIALWGAHRVRASVHRDTETHGDTQRHTETHGDFETRPPTAHTLSIAPRTHARNTQARDFNRDGETDPRPHMHSHLRTPYRCVQMYLYISTREDRFEHLQHPRSHLRRH